MKSSWEEIHIELNQKSAHMAITNILKLVVEIHASLWLFTSTTWKVDHFEYYNLWSISFKKIYSSWAQAHRALGNKMMN